VSTGRTSEARDEKDSARVNFSGCARESAAGDVFVVFCGDSSVKVVSSSIIGTCLSR